MIKKFFCLNKDEQINLIKTSVVLLFSLLMVRIFSSARILKLLRPNIERQSPVIGSVSETESAYSIALLRLQRNLYFEPGCLALCMAYCLLLRVQKVYPKIYLGFNKRQSIGHSSLNFHSWIPISESIIIGRRNDLHEYKTITSGECNVK